MGFGGKMAQAIGFGTGNCRVVSGRHENGPLGKGPKTVANHGFHVLDIRLV